MAMVGYGVLEVVSRTKFMSSQGYREKLIRERKETRKLTKVIKKLLKQGGEFPNLLLAWRPYMLQQFSGLIMFLILLIPRPSSDFGVQPILHFKKYEVNLSTRPEKAVGSDDIWQKATAALRDALDDKGWSYQIDEGGGAFYGPKIDLKIEDALGRKWQCSTVQVDFNLPERFGISYVDSNSDRRRPIMIHRAVLGSLERFFGVLIEHYAGDFPLWISPIQTRVLPVTDAEVSYCKEVASRLKSAGIRAEVCHGERLPKLIRNAEKQKVPLMAVVGPKEVESQTVTIRSRFSGELGTMAVDELISRVHSVIENRTRL